MKFRNIFFFLLVLGTTSCKTDINVFDYFDKTAPFNFHKKDSVLNITDLSGREISPGNAIYLDFVKWLENNKSGWQSTPASFVSEAFIDQNNFRFLYLKDGSGVIIFIDKENKVRQYSKLIKKGDLIFLTKEN